MEITLKHLQEQNPFLENGNDNHPKIITAKELLEQETFLGIPCKTIILKEEDNKNKNIPINEP